ncbi:restriction endonuclease subunit S [Serratia rubidaea]|uniref:restriction endonuclease subunit S n=1 Tax=Serratia rubidaea TaxID=61652 RepID=UPI002DB88032|nr:restriction endonuclease subunit S [Serratia rubidaea]MEB7586964.1 restriction endonuclease subunit S [Serratia rubidaea]
MNEIGYLNKLLDGVDVEWKTLGHVADIKRGTSITKKNVVDGIIPVIAGGRTPAYYHNTSNRDGQTIVIAGSGAYAGFVSWWEQPIFVSDAFTVKPHDMLLPRYCYHFLMSMQQQLHEFKSGGGVPHVYPRDVSPIQIPIPCPDVMEKSIAIQSEIVRILDTFTALTTELTVELNMRKKQYNYYRDQLLNFDDNISMVSLSDCCTSISDGDHQAPPKTNSGIPFITISNITHSNTINFKNTYFVANDYYQKIHNKRKARRKDILYTVVGTIGIPVFIDFDMDFTFQRHMAILRPNEKKIISKYLYHVMRSSDFLKKAHSVAVGAAQKTITLSALNKMNIPIPPISEQEHIVNILDKFDILANSLSEGLPREIELRQKQYEYYRDMIFSFPKPDVAKA